jgi:hypothetical protein
VYTGRAEFLTRYVVPQVVSFIFAKAVQVVKVCLHIIMYRQSQGSFCGINGEQSGFAAGIL